MLSHGAYDGLVVVGPWEDAVPENSDGSHAILFRFVQVHVLALCSLTFVNAKK